MDDLSKLPIDKIYTPTPQEREIVDQYMDPYVEESSYSNFGLIIKLIIIVAGLTALTNNPSLRNMIGRVIGPSYPVKYKSYISAGIMVFLFSAVIIGLNSQQLLL